MPLRRRGHKLMYRRYPRSYRSTIGTCLAIGLAAIAGVALIYYHTQKEIAFRPWAVLAGPLLAAGLAILGYVAQSSGGFKQNGLDRMAWL